MSDSRRHSERTDKVGNEVPEREHGTGGRGETAGAVSASLLAFCTQIRKDADQETERILGRAGLSARKKLEEAERQAESVARQIREGAEVRAKEIEARAMSEVSLEMKRSVLRAQGEIIDEVFARLRESLEKLHGTKGYLDFLKDLTAQGVIALEDEECLVAPATEERRLYDHQLLDEVKELVERRSGRKVKLSIPENLSPEGFGVRVYSGARTMLFDNTVDARVERFADELKNIIATEVFGSKAEGNNRQSDPGKADGG